MIQFLLLASKWSPSMEDWNFSFYWVHLLFLLKTLSNLFSIGTKVNIQGIYKKIKMSYFFVLSARYVGNRLWGPPMTEGSALQPDSCQVAYQDERKALLKHFVFQSLSSLLLHELWCSFKLAERQRPSFFRRQYGRPGLIQTVSPCSKNKHFYSRRVSIFPDILVWLPHLLHQWFPNHVRRSSCLFMTSQTRVHCF